MEKIEKIEKIKTIKKRKSLKRIFGDFMTVLTVIAIFVFSIVFLIFIIFVFTRSYAFATTEKSSSGKFQEAMQYANSLRNTVSIEKNNGKNNLKVGSFKLEPEKVFINPKTEKTQKSWYTDSPTQMNYYKANTQDNAHGMEKDAIAEPPKMKIIKMQMVIQYQLPEKL